MHTFYDFAKDFGGSFATILASAAALTLTYYFNKRQVAIAATQATTAAAQKEIAQAQRDIAYDRLKYDLFGKRYEIYSMTQSLLKLIMNNSVTFADSPKFTQMRIKLREARFFFGEEELRVFDNVRKLSDELLDVNAIKRETKNPNQAQAIQRYPEIIKELVSMYSDLPILMEDALGFTQLKSPGVLHKGGSGEQSGAQ